MNIKFKKLHPYAQIPTYTNDEAAGMDLYSVENITWFPGEFKIVHSGLALEIPDNYYIEIYNRSGLASKKQLVMMSSGIIDSDYRGEIVMPIKNWSIFWYTLNKGERFGQMILKRNIKMIFQEVEELSKTSRGEGGFGSTGT